MTTLNLGRVVGRDGAPGQDGEDGRGIVSILKTATQGNVDTYTITYTDNTTSTFEVTNGLDGQDGAPGQDGQDGAPGRDGQDGDDGRGIVNIEKTSTSGLVDTYTITYTDGTTSTFEVTNGESGGGSGDYTDLENKPSINDVTLSGNKTSSDLGIQAALVSGTNIKTINNESILGSGNIDIQGGGGTSVEANPELSGDEAFLKGLKVGSTKYSTRPDLSGKVISIMGDSISTYAGWIPNSDGIDDGTGTLRHAIFYPNYGSYVNNVNMTWWHKLIFDKFKAKLGVNESWSGSFVGNNKDTNTATTTTCHAPGNDTGPDTCMAGNTRIKRLAANGTPDIIYVYGGTNDIAQPGTPGETLGTFNNSTDYSTVDITTTKWSTFVDAYRTMIQRMQYYYPKAKIIALLPAYCHSYYNRAKLEQWTEQIREICDYFGVNYIDLRACGITWANSSSGRNAKGIQTLGDNNIHPNDLGHTMIADYVESETYKILQQDFVKNEVYTVTNNLSTLTNPMSYVTGVTKGERYSATLTGADLTVGRVAMGGTDITSTAYNSSTGVITIASVTGNIVINEGEAIITPVAGVSLNASTKSIMPNDVETLTATIVPANATNKNVTWSANNNHVTISPNGLSCTVTGASNGTSIVTVTTEDGNYTATCTFTVHEIVLDHIAITTPPSTTAYHYGDTFSKTGMVVTAYYDDETSDVLDDNEYTVSPSGALTDSDTSVTVSYTYNGVTKTATQAITVSTLSSIEITTQPTQTEYVVGETFNPAGMVVTATWSDNSTSTVTGYTFTPSGALTEEDTTITISYTVGGVTKTTTQTITFIQGTVWYTNVYEFTGWTNPTERSITTAGDFAYVGDNVKALYRGHRINRVRLWPAQAGTVTVRVYNDASDIIGRKDTASLRDTSQIATITITQAMVTQGGYQEIPLSNTLTIGENQFWSIGTEGDTGLFKYTTGGASSYTGYNMYNNLGTTKAVQAMGVSVGLCVDMGFRGSEEPATLSSIAVTTAPTKTTYVAGQSFDPTGMVVTATYSDATTKTVSGYTYSPNGALTTSDSTITISYTEGGATVTTTQSITVNSSPLASIAVTTAPTKTSYYEGETFSDAGMVVTATYEDSTTATVTGYVLTLAGGAAISTPLTTSDTEVTVSFTQGGVTKTTTQAITVEEAPETTWYTNVYQFSGWGNPTANSITTAGDFGYCGSDVKALYEGQDINMVRLVPARAGTITVRVYNDADNIIGRTDSATLRDDSKIATITITQEMVSKGGYQEIPLSNTLHIGEGQFWTIQTAGDTGLFKFVNSATIPGWPNGYRFYNMLGTTDAVILTSGQNALCVDMGYRA